MERRRGLENIGEGEIQTFTGIFIKTGERKLYNGYRLKTVLLADIKDERGNIVADHLWFKETKKFKKVQPFIGDKLQFTAKVGIYTKGYKEYKKNTFCPIKQDYMLFSPTNIKKL